MRLFSMFASQVSFSSTVSIAMVMDFPVALMVKANRNPRIPSTWSSTAAPTRSICNTMVVQDKSVCIGNVTIRVVVQDTPTRSICVVKYIYSKYSALEVYKRRVKATPVRRQENKKNPVWDSRLEMVWPLTGIAEVSYTLRSEHSEVRIHRG